jgi:hypothetical protein
MKEMNGFQLFEQDEQRPELPAGLTADLSVVSRFGFKIGQLDGKPVWEAATEEDYRNAEARRLSVNPEDVQIALECVQTGPFSCAGNCYDGFCKLIYSPTSTGDYYYCACTYS